MDHVAVTFFVGTVVTATPTAVLVLCVAVPFAWWGAVLAISFIETPLKFRAPGISVELGVGIGRLVFKALNVLEFCLAVAIIVGIAAANQPRTAAWILAGILLITLVTQAWGIRPRLDRRANSLATGGPATGRSHLHFAYIAGEVIKLAALPTLSVLLANRLA